MEFGSLGQGLSGGYLNTVPPNATREEQIAAINDIIGRLNSMLKTQIYSDGESKRFLQGYQPEGWPGGDFGMKISLPGVDVTQASDDELVFSWDFTTGTQIFYDPAVPGLDVGMQGILPNNKSGQAWAKDGETVKGAFGV